jgi:SAM-dependent methyltransferase
VGLSVTHRTRAPASTVSDHAEVVWHDLECGSYRADLPLWRELAARNPGPILEIGAGTGRVALELARAGHVVTALEREPALLDALRRRPGAERARTVCADARGVELPQAHFALCLVPMQMIQLLSGPSERARFLSRVRATLRRGGLLACAVLARVDPFACASEEAGPAPETVRIDGLLYTSRATRVAVGRTQIVIERERRILEPRGRSSPNTLAPSRTRLLRVEHNVVGLERLSPRTLQREGGAAGMRVEPVREVSATEDHTGSTVVMLRA